MLRGLLNQHQIIKRFVLFCIAGLIVVGSFSDWLTFPILGFSKHPCTFPADTP